MTTTTNIRIATINVRTLHDDIKLALAIKSTEQLKIDILALQETRRTGTGVSTFDDPSIAGWQLVWSGHKRKREHGVGMILAPHVILDHHEEHLQARIISARVRVHGMRFYILNVYAPTDCTQSEAAKSSFYSALSKAKLEIDKSPSYKLIVLGDWNATISAASKLSGAWDSVLGCNNPDRVETNGNGERMLGWCLKNKMKILNSIFRTKRIHRDTWQHAATGKWKRIDYICTTRWLSKFVQSCRVYIGPSLLFDTDHRLLVMNISLPGSRRDLRIRVSRTSSNNATPKTDFGMLRNDVDIRQQLTDKLEHELEALECDDVDELNNRITETLKSSADDVCPKTVAVKKKEPWDDAVILEQMRELRKCSSTSAIRAQQKLIRKRRNRLMNDYYKEQADKINTAAEARDVEKEFALARKYSALRRSTRLTISNEKLKTHFEEHFSMRELPIPPEIEHPEQFPYLREEPVVVDEGAPTAVEVKGVLKSFKNNKSAGTDKLRTECLKYNESQHLVMKIVHLLTLIWTLLVIPTAWLHATITCLYKKGAKNLASNYRGLSIGANMSRIIAKIVTARIKSAYEKQLSEAQFGFRANRSTNDGIFILNTIIEKYNEPLVAIYVDLTAAYDHIPRDLLFRVIEFRTGARHIVNILRKMYEGTTASIRGMSSMFSVKIGCRQGGQESPVLFNYYFDFVLKVAADAIDQAFPDGWGIAIDFNIPYMCTNREQRRDGRMSGADIIHWILYADDLVLFCKSVDEAEKLLTIINETCLRFGLTISFKKTKTQVFNNNTLATKPSLLSVGDTEIENVQQFVYLGHSVTGEEGCFTEHRIARASAKFNELRHILTDSRINMQTRRKYLYASVRSRLTSGTQACLPNERQIRKLESFWGECLRSMVSGGWRRQRTPEGAEERNFSFVYTNDRVMQITRAAPVRNFIHTQYLKYIGHVCRGNNNSIAKKILFAKPTRPYYRNVWIKISDLLAVSEDQAKRLTQSRREFEVMMMKIIDGGFDR